MEVLVRRAKKGDTEAFAKLILQNEQCMYKIAWSYLKNEEDVADVLQETILICFEKLKTLRQDSYFKTWLIRILINQCNNLLRAGKNYGDEDSIRAVEVKETGYEECEWKEVLSDLDEKYRVIIMLYYGQKFSIKEISEMLELKQNTVSTRLARAREQLRKVYQL